MTLLLTTKKQTTSFVKICTKDHMYISYPFLVFLYTFFIISGGMPYLLATWNKITRSITPWSQHKVAGEVSMQRNQFTQCNILWQKEEKQLTASTISPTVKLSSISALYTFSSSFFTYMVTATRKSTQSYIDTVLDFSWL